MKLLFKDFNTKETIATKMIDVGAHVPRNHDTVIINDSRCVVVSVEYFLKNIENELYEK